MIRNLPPKDSLVVTAGKMEVFFDTFNLGPDEETDWKVFFKHPRLSQIFSSLNIYHHLVGAPPTEPALPPTSFEHFMFTLLMTSPAREARRLHAVLRSWNIPGIPAGPPPRDSFPPEADLIMRKAWNKVLDDHLSSPASASMVIIPSPNNINPTDYLTETEKTATAPPPPPAPSAGRYSDRPTLGDDPLPPPSRKKSTRGRRTRPPSPDDDYDDDSPSGAALYDDPRYPAYPPGYYPSRREPSRPPPTWTERREREASRPPPTRADGDPWRGEREREGRRYSHSHHHSVGGGGRKRAAY